MYDETVGRSSSSLSSDLRSLISFLNNFNLDTSLPGRLFYPSTLATIENEFRPSAISTGRASSSQNILQDSSDNSLQINRENSPRIIPQYQQHQNEWDFGEKIAKIQELHEAQKRASAMEIHMRWWMATSESWREKWNMVRNERNRIRDENIRLRNLLSKAKTDIQQMCSEKDRNQATIRDLSAQLYSNGTERLCLHKNFTSNQFTMKMEPIEKAYNLNGKCKAKGKNRSKSV